MIVLAVGVIGVVVGFAAGHTAGQLLFGTKFTLDNVDVGLLAVGSGAFIFALTLAQALIALRSYAAATLSWVAGAVGCVVGADEHPRPLPAVRAQLRDRRRCSPRLAMFVCLAFASAVGIPMGTMERLVDRSRARTARDLASWPVT